MDMNDGCGVERPVNPHAIEYELFARRYRPGPLVVADGLEVRFASGTQRWRVSSSAHLVMLTVHDWMSVTFLGCEDVPRALERASEPDVFADGAPRIDFRAWAGLLAWPAAEAAFEFSIEAFAEAAGEEAARAVASAAERDWAALPGVLVPVVLEARALVWWDEHVEPLVEADVYGLRASFQRPRPWFLEVCWLVEAAIRGRRA